MSQRTALVLGATGLVGECTVRHLLDEPAYSKVKVLVRKAYPITHENLTVVQADFNRLEDYSGDFQVDDVFCCIGTTMKKAGNRDAFRKVDYDIPVKAARIAQMNSSQFLLVSSIGANPQSGNFYLRTKGEAEKSVLETTLETIHILRPSVLMGSRKEARLGESLGKFFIKTIEPILIFSLKKYRGIQADTVAKALVNLALENKKGKYFYESNHLEYIARKKPITSSKLIVDL